MFLRYECSWGLSIFDRGVSQEDLCLKKLILDQEIYRPRFILYRENYINNGIQSLCLEVRTMGGSVLQAMEIQG